MVVKIHGHQVNHDI